MFDHIIGNEQAKTYLTRTAAKGTVGNSLLFAGPDGIGKSLFAEAFAKLLICQNDPQQLHQKKIAAGNHPDIRIYRPEGKVGMHSIAAMRQFTEEVYLAPCESPWKVFIVHNADRMLTYSANALLKTFEEPPPDAVIILLSSAPASLLPTVLSRCRTLFFHALTPSEVANFLTQRSGKTQSEADQIARMAHGSIGQALRLATEGAHPSRGILLDMLAGGKMQNYNQLTEAASTLAERIEEIKKEVEAEVRQALQPVAGTDISATQKQSMEKEIEGIAALSASQEAHVLFDHILAWYRDVHLLQADGNIDYLMHPDYAEAVRKMGKAGDYLTIEVVQKAVAEARLSLERSTSLHICFENLFLKLNLL